MKKTILSMLILSSVSTFANNSFKVIISSEANDYEVGGFTIETIYSEWAEKTKTCVADITESDLYFNDTAEQTESCDLTEERTVTTKRVYYSGSEEIISVEQETRDLNTVTKQNITGTHTENSCNDILNNNYSKGDGVYRITSGIDVYCDQTTNGGGWTLVFNHDILSAGVFSSESEVLNVNESNPSLSTTKYSILNRIDTFKRSNKYEFRMKWKNYSATQIWRQTSNPTTSAISGYEAISIDSTSNYWGGLERGAATNNNSSLVDGSVNHTNWYYAVGSFVNWNPGNICNGNIPLSTEVAGNSCGVPNVNLWIR
jgi:hypothetical protein